MTNPVIEAIAKEMFRGINEAGASGVVLDPHEMARAALKATRDNVTEEMVEVGHGLSHRLAEYLPVHTPHDIAQVFTAMIDTALEENPAKGESR